jgi:hypothetical protein
MSLPLPQGCSTRWGENGLQWQWLWRVLAATHYLLPDHRVFCNQLVTTTPTLVTSRILELYSATCAWTEEAGQGCCTMHVARQRNSHSTARPHLVSERRLNPLAPSRSYMTVKLLFKPSYLPFPLTKILLGAEYISHFFQYDCQPAAGH